MEVTIIVGSDRVLGKCLVGPFDFLNHACDQCAKLRWEENETEKKVYCTFKRGKIIKKDEEVFINYREVDSNDVEVYSCGVCN